LSDPSIVLYNELKYFAEFFAEYTQKNEIPYIKKYSYQEEKEIDFGGA
jgi:hypothetical protein